MFKLTLRFEIFRSTYTNDNLSYGQKNLQIFFAFIAYEKWRYSSSSADFFGFSSGFGLGFTGGAGGFTGGAGRLSSGAGGRGRASSLKE